MLFASTAAFAGGLGLLSALPSTFTARALVGPVAGVYDGPADLLVDQVLAPASLAAVASDAGLRRQRSLGEMLTGAPADPAGRLAARVEVRGSPASSIVIEACGRTPEAAVEAADRIAARLVACEASHRERLRGAAPVESAATTAPTAPADATPSVPARLLLEQLRLRHPLLRDPAPERRLQDLAQRLSDDRIAVAALEVQLDGLNAEAERLEQLVTLEANHAWRLDLAERQAQAARLARPELPRDPRTDPSPAPAVSAPPSRIAELEAELARLLASRTSLHPDVRRLVRLLESERQRVISLSSAGEPGAPAEEPPTRPRQAPAQRAALPLDDDAPLLVPVADGPPELVAPAPQGGPEAWRQRAPSYPAWIQAQQRAEEVQLQLVARTEEQAARQREYDLLQQQLVVLREPRLDEARLQERVKAEEEEEARRHAVPAAPTGARSATTAPLAVLQAAGVHAERSPLAHLPAWALASLIVPLLGGLLLELRDGSVRGIEDVEGLGAPVLGSVPHLRARGR